MSSSSYNDFQNLFTNLCDFDEIFSSSVNILHKFVKNRRTHCKSNIVKRYSKILDQLNDQDWLYNENFFSKSALQWNNSRKKSTSKKTPKNPSSENRANPQSTTNSNEKNQNSEVSKNYEIFAYNSKDNKTPDENYNNKNLYPGNSFARGQNQLVLGGGEPNGPRKAEVKRGKRRANDTF